MEVYIKINEKKEHVVLVLEKHESYDSFRKCIESTYKINAPFNIYENGVLLGLHNFRIKNFGVYSFSPKLVGGKGGFGSLLKENN